MVKDLQRAEKCNRVLSGAQAEIGLAWQKDLWKTPQFCSQHGAHVIATSL